MPLIEDANVCTLCCKEVAALRVPEPIGVCDILTFQRLNVAMLSPESDANGGLSNPNLSSALRDIIREFRADSGTIHLLNAEGLLELKAHHGIPDPVLNIIRIIPVGKGMAGLAVERREPVSACNIQTDKSGDVRPGAKATAMQGAIVVPMMSGDRAIGALGIANAGERTFSNDEVTHLSQLGVRLAQSAF
jgi:signal transduction protein with GAF and PtsI domain